MTVAATPGAPAATALPVAGAVPRGPVIAIFSLAVAWCAVLGTLVLTAANPIVVNPVQILHADVVVQGIWIPGHSPEIDVKQVWKGTLPLGRLAVTGMLREQTIANEVVVPLTRDQSGLWKVTGGVLTNPPHDPRRDSIPVDASIRPVVYPATEAVLQQLRALLGEVPAPPASGT